MSRERTATRAEQRVGQHVARQWLLEALLDTGFLADVYRGRNEHGQRVAVAVLRPELAQDPELRRAFVEGPRAAQRLRHADVPRVFGDGETQDGLPVLLSELLEGESLGHLIARRPGKIPPSEALRIVAELLGVLHAAHQAAVIHGALEPRRAFVTETGAVKLLGFGSGRVRELAARRLGLEHPPGYPDYVSPEVERGGAADEASDQWSAGAILFALLTGEPPRARPGDGKSVVRSLREVAPDAPPVLVSVTDRALAASPHSRFESVALMLHAVVATSQHPEIAQLRTVSMRPRARLSPAAGVVARRVISGAVTLPALRASQQLPTAAPSLAASRSRPPPRPTLPDLAAIDGADATAREAEELSDIFGLLDLAVSARIDSNQGARDAREPLRRLHDRALRALSLAPAGLVWSVEPWGFVAGSWDLWAPEGLLASLPHRLYADGVRLLGLRPGITEIELEALVELLALAALDALPEDEDTVTLLWGADFAHVTHRAVEPRHGRLSAELTTRTEQLERELWALATFDTSMQLEEQWRLARTSRRSSVPPAPQRARAGAPPSRGWRREAGASLLRELAADSLDRGTPLDRLRRLESSATPRPPSEESLSRLVRHGELVLAMERLLDRVGAGGIGAAAAQDAAAEAARVMTSVLASGGPRLEVEIEAGELLVAGELPVGPRSLHAAARRIARILHDASVSRMVFHREASRGALLQLADRLIRAERAAEVRESWPPQPGVDLHPSVQRRGAVTEPERLVALLAEVVAVWQLTGGGERRRQRSAPERRALRRSVRRLVLGSAHHFEGALGLLPLGAAVPEPHVRAVFATFLALVAGRWLELAELPLRGLGLACAEGAPAPSLHKAFLELLSASDATPAEALERVVASCTTEKVWVGEALRGLLGAAPPGTPVELSDGRWAVVLGPGAGPGPLVSVVIDGEGRAVEPPQPVSLAASGLLARRCLGRDEVSFNLARPFFLHG